MEPYQKTYMKKTGIIEIPELADNQRWTGEWWYNDEEKCFERFVTERNISGMSRNDVITIMDDPPPATVRRKWKTQ